MTKPTLTPRPRNAWALLDDLLPGAVMGGLRKARKYAAVEPSDEAIVEQVCRYVKEALADEFVIGGED